MTAEPIPVVCRGPHGERRDYQMRVLGADELGLLAQLLGWNAHAEVGGETSLALLERRLRLSGPAREQVIASYILTYDDGGFTEAVDSNWDAAIRAYEAGAAQIPNDLRRDPLFSDAAAILTYNALVLSIIRDGLTPEHSKALTERIFPPKGLFVQRVQPLPFESMTRAAMMLLATFLHDQGQYGAAAAWYAMVAAPHNQIGREAGRRLRFAANNEPLNTGHSVPGTFGVKFDMRDHLWLRTVGPRYFSIYSEAGEAVPRLSTSTINQGVAFEEKCLRLIRSMGISAHTTNMTGDGGIDIVGYSKQPLLTGTLVIQCKDWVSPVGEPVLRDLYGAVSAKQAMKGICITSGSFTRQARQFARTLPLELIDGAALSFWLDRYIENDSAGDSLPDVSSGEAGAEAAATIEGQTP